ncbi:uncharacterized protein LOC115591902 isoform X2 [Sparus aurata]|uniref:uncharacterized protein LOC115591902 isoform X2 n=1 Tax=Sparus aurata TaxID=8175 RepID=UPI0011C1AA8C|nr:uncharacterized protein LOC115591902 isoform X2 [Sparus aurata]
MNLTIACYESIRSAPRASLSAHANGSYREQSLHLSSTVALIPEQLDSSGDCRFCSSRFCSPQSLLISRSRIINTQQTCSFTLTAATAPQVTLCGLLDTEEDVRMDTALTFIFLLRCWCVGSLPRGQSVSFSVAFSGGTLLLVDVEDAAEHDHHRHKTTGAFAGSGPSVQVLSSVPLSLDPGSPRLLVCLLAGLNSPLQDVLWWVDDTPVTSSDSQVSWMMSDGGGAYSATSVWEVSAAEWRSRSTYWCGTVQEGRVFRQKVCWRDEDQLRSDADT